MSQPSSPPRATPQMAELEQFFTQARAVTQAAMETAQVNAATVQNLIAAQVQQAQPQQSDPGSPFPTNVLQAKDLAKVLRQPKEFRPAAREEELSQWKSWSRELENYLMALDLVSNSRRCRLTWQIWILLFDIGACFYFLCLRVYCMRRANKFLKQLSEWIRRL